MVKILVKNGNDVAFLYETHIDTSMDTIYKEIVTIFNAQIKITDVCYELEQLAQYGPAMPLRMQGLAPGQAEELGLKDDFAEQLEDDWIKNEDPLGRRCGRQPPQRLRSVLLSAKEEAKQTVSKANAEAGQSLNIVNISETLHRLRGAVLVLLPNGLPDHDPAHLAQFECDNPFAIPTTLKDMLGSDSVLWFCGRQLPHTGKLSAALSMKNDKTKVTVKITNGDSGPPAREPVITEEERLQLMAHYHRKQEELEFETRPTKCITTETIHQRGSKNCSWSSCREGCTKEVYNCTMIFVNYKILEPEVIEEITTTQNDTEVTSPLPRIDYEASSTINEWSVRVANKVKPTHYGDHEEEESGGPIEWSPDWIDRTSPHKLSRREVDNLETESPFIVNDTKWFLGAKLFPNVKGCGYPPALNCTTFLWGYQTIGANYSCYYSKVDPLMVVSDLDMRQVYINLILATAIPIPSFIISVIYLAFAYFVIYAEEPPERATSIPEGGAPEDELDCEGDEDKVTLAEDQQADDLLQGKTPSSEEGFPDIDADDVDIEADELPDKKSSPSTEVPPPSELIKPAAMMVVRPNSLQPSGPIAAV